MNLSPEMVAAECDSGVGHAANIFDLPILSSRAATDADLIRHQFLHIVRQFNGISLALSPSTERSLFYENLTSSNNPLLHFVT
jgi:hypothetical protein